MELTKRIEGTRQFGNEFLTWLMFRSLSSDGQIDLPMGRIELWLEDRLTLVAPFAGREVNILKGESPAQGEEAGVALRTGKQLDNARISISWQGKRWDFQFSAPGFAFSSVKVPAVLTETQYEAISDRFDLLGTLEEIMRSLYHEFLNLRTDDGRWQVERSRMEQWLRQR